MQNRETPIFNFQTQNYSITKKIKTSIHSHTMKINKMENGERQKNQKNNEKF